jgi:predicted GIY-YIG superfamily endonuclease
MKSDIKLILRMYLQEQRIKWDLNMVLDLARTYTKMNDFKQNEPRAYGAARKNGWLDDVRELMVPAYEDWSDVEKIYQEASKYETLNDFRNMSPKAYASAKYKNIIDNLKLFLKPTPSNKPSMSPEEVTQESKKYLTKKEFRTQSPLAYRLAIKYNLFGKTITHLGDKQIRKESGYWTYEKLKAEAFKYKSKKEFSEKNSGAVSTAKKMGIWDEITSHMETLGSLYERAVYAWEFPDKSVYVGLTFNLSLRASQHLDEEGKTQVSKYIKQTKLVPVFVLVSDFVDQKDAQNLENCTIEEYKTKGWNILNKVKAGGLGSCRRKWTYDTLKDEASKYDNVADFKKYSYSAYVSAQKYGFFKELTKDMTRKVKSR